MALTDSQQRIADALIKDVFQGVQRIKLIGSAGTGKTYLTGELVQLLLNIQRKPVWVTAPTNKALAILMKKLSHIDSDRLIFKTIHSALKMTLHTNGKTGERKFIQNKYIKKGEDDFRQAGVCFIDETSMLNTELMGYLEDYKFPIIFVGDDKQLNPVGEAISPIWLKEYKTYELTEIIRQGAGNPIIDLSRDIDMLFFKIPKIIEGLGYDYSEDRAKMIDNLAMVNGTDELKYLTYTNPDVDGMNQFVRERRYGRPQRIELDETVVFNTPHGEFYTNREVKVIQADIVTDYIEIPKYDTKYMYDGTTNGVCDKVKMKFYRVNGGFDVVHEHSDAVFQTIAKTIKDNCVKFAWNWKGYYRFIERFADIKYNHAITVHKSQGSTYKESIINIGNIMINRNAEERQRLLYTGITRASDFITLNNVK